MPANISAQNLFVAQKQTQQDEIQIPNGTSKLNLLPMQQQNMTIQANIAPTLNNEIFESENSNLAAKLSGQPIFLPANSLPMPLQYFYATNTTNKGEAISLPHSSIPQPPIFFNGTNAYFNANHNFNQMISNTETGVYFKSQSPVFSIESQQVQHEQVNPSVQVVKIFK